MGAPLPDCQICPVARLTGTASLRSARPTGTDVTRLDERNESALSISTDTMEGRFRPACPACVGIQIPARSPGESMTAAAHGAAQPAAAGCGLLLRIGEYPPACNKKKNSFRLMYKLQSCVSPPPRLFLTLLGFDARCILMADRRALRTVRITVCIYSTWLVRGTWRSVSCLHLGGSWTDRSCHPSKVPGGSRRQSAGSVRFGSTG